MDRKHAKEQLQIQSMQKEREGAKYITEKHSFSQWRFKVGAYLRERFCVKYARHLILHSISDNNNREVQQRQLQSSDLVPDKSSRIFTSFPVEGGWGWVDCPWDCEGIKLLEPPEGIIQVQVMCTLRVLFCFVFLEEQGRRVAAMR